MKLRTLAPAGWGVAAVLAPKCPACVAAYLTALGWGAGVSAGLAVALRPTLWGLGWLSAALLLTGWVRRRRARSKRTVSSLHGCQTPS